MSKIEAIIGNVFIHQSQSNGTRLMKISMAQRQGYNIANAIDLSSGNRIRDAVIIRNIADGNIKLSNII